MTKLSEWSIASVATAVITVSTALLMVGIVPFSENLLDDSKLYLLFLIALVLGVLFALTVIRRGAIELILSKLTYAVLAFLVAISASTFLTSPYPVKALLSYGGIFIAAAAIVLFASPLLTKASRRIWITTYNLVALILVITSFLELIGIGPSRLLPLVGPFTAPTVPLLFNLSGSILNALQLCIIGIVGIFATWLTTKKAQPVQLVTVVVMLLGILLYGYYLLPGKSNLQLPSFGASWSVALDSVRDPRGALIGSGTGGYQDMYQRFRPVWVNATPQWNATFSVGANMPLTLLTISGFIGLIAWLSMVIIVFLHARKAKPEEVPVIAMLLTTFAVQLFFPPNSVVIAIQAMLLALFIASKRHDFGVLHFSFFHAKVHRLTQMLPGRQVEPRWPLYLTSGIIMLLLAISSYFLGRFYLGSYYSLAAAKDFEANDAIGVYENQQRATAYNPYFDLYRRRYANTSLGIAEVLSQKTDKTAQDTTTISELVQQAVREGQASITLDPADAQNHALLASIYQRLIGGVDGAESFAEQYYVQAINLYPSAPELYISLAGIYLQQERWDRAANVLNQSLQVKSDYPNTWFNLGFALEKLNAAAEAKAAYERTITFVADPNSQDYLTLTKKIEELGRIVDEQKAAAEQQAAAANPKRAPIQNESQNPSAVELNLNNQDQTVTQPRENVQVDEQALPEATPTPSPNEEATPTPSPNEESTPTPSPAP